MMAGESLESGQLSRFGKHFGIQFNRCMGTENAGTAAVGFLLSPGVWGRVGAQEKPRMATGCCGDQCAPMGFPFEYRQAVVMRPNTTLEHRVAIQQKMLRRDGRGNARASGGHEFHGGARRDVFQNDSQAREAIRQRRQGFLNEHGLAIEDIHLRRNRFPMQEKRQIQFLHLGEDGRAAPGIPYSGIRIGGPARRVVLDCMHVSRGLGSSNFCRRCVFREVKRHQGLEGGLSGQGREDSVPVGQSLRGCRDRGLQIGHDDSPAELSGACRNHAAHRITIAKMQMPVVGARQGNSIHGTSNGCLGHSIPVRIGKYRPWVVDHVQAVSCTGIV